ncbi:DNA topoisomerase 3 [Neisseria sp. Ec49-e6-T10]|uniref:DNA topoisomerase 3 n=1 Tax=Neisseria sp. Ec49-e6-T10 TaxID=3140744 RepID=UPI003EBC9E8E
MTTLYLCEKPSQAKDIGKILGVLSGKHDGYYQKGDVIVTWGYGHLISLSPPAAYSEELANFGNINALPIIPDQWLMETLKKTEKQVNLIKKLLAKADSVVISTDADREGEVIAREILDYCHYKGKISRLWLQSLDDASIKAALKKILPGSSKEGLYQAGLARSHADWLTGMNLSRAFTVVYGSGVEGVLSIGRVQTPTLSLVVQRDLIIENFVPYEHYSLHPIFITAQKEHFKAIWQIPETLKNTDGFCVGLSYVLSLINQLNASDTTARVISAQTSRKKTAPPLPYSLSELQKEASKKLGISVAKVLDVAQALYEKYKVTSYPRTPCRYLPLSQKSEVSEVLAAIVQVNPQWSEIVAKANPNKDASVWNDNQVAKASHHAIIPTKVAKSSLGEMTKIEFEIYNMIVKRYVAQFYPDYEYDSTIIELSCVNELFKAIGNIPRLIGWKEVTDDVVSQSKDQAQATQLPVLTEGDQVTPAEAQLIKSKTSPPPRFIEGSLLDEMKSLSSIMKQLEDQPQLKKIFKDTQGLGTEATRANIIKRLIDVGFIEVNSKKQLISTHKARSLLEKIPPIVADPINTAKWEQALSGIENGKLTYDVFMQVQKDFITQLVEEAKELVKKNPQLLTKSQNFAQKTPKSTEKLQKKEKVGNACPTCKQGTLVLREFKKEPSKKYLGCSGFPECRFFQWMQ